MSGQNSATPLFVLHTDANINGLGAVFEQEQSDGKLHPVAYRSLRKGEINYGVTELEALALLSEALQTLLAGALLSGLYQSCTFEGSKPVW